jgi:hypothetical protein
MKVRADFVAHFEVRERPTIGSGGLPGSSSLT